MVTGLPAMLWSWPFCQAVPDYVALSDVRRFSLRAALTQLL
jgi:hypothetical protein